MAQLEHNHDLDVDKVFDSACDHMTAKLRTATTHRETKTSVDDANIMENEMGDVGGFGTDMPSAMDVSIAQTITGLNARVELHGAVLVHRRL